MNHNEELQAVERAIELLDTIGGYPTSPRFCEDAPASARSVGHLFTDEDRAVLEAAWAVMEAHSWTGPKWPPGGLHAAVARLRPGPGVEERLSAPLRDG